MEWNVRLAVAMAATVTGLVVISLSVWWAVNQPTRYAPDQIPVAPRPTVTRQPTGSTHLRAGESLEVRARISELEARLQQQERLVAAKNRELQELQQTMRSLREELADTADWARLSELGLLDANDPAPTADPPLPEVPPNVPLEAPPAEASPAVEPNGLAQTLREAELEFSLEQASMRAEALEAELIMSRSAKQEVLRRIGPAALDGLIEALQSPNVAVRIWACEALADLGEDAMEAAEPLQRLLEDDDDPEVRLRATMALTRVRP